MFFNSGIYTICVKLSLISSVLMIAFHLWEENTENEWIISNVKVIL